jgi:hypothetical protein
MEGILNSAIADTVRVGYFWWNVDDNKNYSFVLVESWPKNEMEEMGKTSHFNLWWKALNKGMVEGEYDSYPRGRVEIDPGLGTQTVYHGYYEKTPEGLKKIIAQKFNTNSDTVWEFNSHYDMENPSEHFRGKDEEERPWDVL